MYENASHVFYHSSYLGIAIDLAAANLRARISYFYKAYWSRGASFELLHPSLRAQLRPAVVPKLQAKLRARVRGPGQDQGVLGDVQGSLSLEL